MKRLDFLRTLLALPVVAKILPKLVESKINPEWIEAGKHPHWAVPGGFVNGEVKWENQPDLSEINKYFADQIPRFQEAILSRHEKSNHLARLFDGQA